MAKLQAEIDRLRKPQPIGVLAAIRQGSKRRRRPAPGRGQPCERRDEWLALSSSEEVSAQS
jgi:hypothetical protein